MKLLYETGDLLFVKDNTLRINALKFLCIKQDFVKTKELTEALKVDRGKLYFHIKGLQKKGLVEFEHSMPRKVYVKITEKGKQVVEEIERNKRKVNGTS